jgi:hypothetical protein
LGPSAATTADITLETLLEMLGSTAPEAAAKNPHINAYSVRSCPFVSFQIFSFKMAFRSAVIYFLLGSI